ncbi:MAG: hypothetical protein AAF721_07685 [Myxococcota bacterium]
MLLALFAASLVGPAPLDGVVSVNPAGDTCLSSASVAEAASVWLGDSEVDPRIAIEVDATADSIAFRLLRDGEVRVERALSPAPPACSDRRAALGLSIAMALDATVLGSLAPPPEPVVEPTPEPAPPEPEVEVPTLPPEPAEPVPTVEPNEFRFSLAASGIASFGVTPGAAFGGELTAELGFVPWLDIVVGGEGLGGLPIALGGGDVGTAIAAGRVAACPSRAFGRVRPRLCVGVAAGALIAAGRNFQNDQTARLPWVAIESGGDLDVRIASRVALRVGVRAVAPLIRNNLDVRDPANAVVEAREIPSIGVAGTLGVVIRVAGSPP